MTLALRVPGLVPDVSQDSGCHPSSTSVHRLFGFLGPLSPRPLLKMKGRRPINERDEEQFEVDTSILSHWELEYVLGPRLSEDGDDFPSQTTGARPETADLECQALYPMACFLSQSHGN